MMSMSRARTTKSTLKMCLGNMRIAAPEMRWQFNTLAGPVRRAEDYRAQCVIGTCVVPSPRKTYRAWRPDLLDEPQTQPHSLRYPSPARLARRSSRPSHAESLRSALLATPRRSPEMFPESGNSEYWRRDECQRQFSADHRSCAGLR